MKRAYRFCLITTLFATLWVTYAQSTLADLLQVEVRIEENTVVLGVSVFTREQLETFITSTQTLLKESSTLPSGETLTLYQPGLEGYISLGVYADADRPPFLLSLFSETPVAVESAWGVKAMAILLAEAAARLENTAALPATP